MFIFNDMSEGNFAIYQRRQIFKCLKFSVNKNRTLVQVWSENQRLEGDVVRDLERSYPVAGCEATRHAIRNERTLWESFGLEREFNRDGTLLPSPPTILPLCESAMDPAWDP